jgi:hypothetical protein
METEQNPTEESQETPDDAGQQGAGAAIGGDEGLDGGSEPEGEDARDAERP